MLRGGDSVTWAAEASDHPCFVLHNGSVIDRVPELGGRTGFGTGKLISDATIWNVDTSFTSQPSKDNFLIQRHYSIQR